MSSSAISKPYLGPSDLAMLERVLARANCMSTAANNFEHRRIAALLIRKFQEGMTTESDLLNAAGQRSRVCENASIAGLNAKSPRLTGVSL